MTRGGLAARRLPGPLRVGDRVVLVAPAGPVPPDLLDTGAAQLREWGLRVELAPHVRDRHPELDYLAGTDRDRAADLVAAWCDPGVAAVVCARGGYGCLRVLEHLDWSAMRAAGPTVFTGSSDVTALHDAIACHLDVATWFTPMPGTAGFTEDPAAREGMRRALLEPAAGRVLAGPAARTLVPGRARGIGVGGNASLVVSALGTPDQPPPPVGGIALLEDVTEDPYRLDRIITQLLRAGWFDGVAGIAFGSFTRCGDPLPMLLDRLAGLGVPMVWDLGFGHCAGQLSVPLGVPVELDADTGTLTILDL